MVYLAFLNISRGSAVTAVMIVTTSDTLVITIACGKAPLILYFQWCPGLQIQLLVHTNTIARRAQIQCPAEEREPWHCLVWQSKAGLRAWIDSRVEFPPPLWDLNSIGGPRRTRDWAGKGGHWRGPEGTRGDPPTCLISGQSPSQRQSQTQGTSPG